MRALLALDETCLALASRLFVRAVFAYQRKRARGLGIEGAKCGAVVFNPR